MTARLMKGSNIEDIEAAYNRDGRTQIHIDGHRPFGSIQTATAYIKTFCTGPSAVSYLDGNQVRWLARF